MIGVFWAKEGRQSAVKNNPRRKTILKNLLHAILIIIDPSTNAARNTSTLREKISGYGVIPFILIRMPLESVEETFLLLQKPLPVNRPPQGFDLF